MDHYKVLNVSPECSESEIKQSYRALSFKYHPDRNKDADAGDKIRAINEAYEVLSDKQRRAQYDCERSGNPLESILNELFKQNHTGRGMNHIFKQNMMFPPGQGFSQGQGFEVMFSNEMPFFNQAPNFNQAPKSPPPVLEKKVDVTFEESYKGGNIPIMIEREIKAGPLTFIEQERIYVVIPQGIDDGEILSIPEKGHCYSDVKGEIKLRIHIVAHPMFERRGLNLVYHQKITFKESICGFEGILQHVDGTSMRLVSSKGNVIQNGDERNVKGRGLTRNTQVGDLIILFNVAAPKELTEEQIKTFELIL
jgi:DnaJ-class molecular chaperone